MARITTIIVDDEQEARRGLRRLLERDERLSVIAECRSGLEAVRAVEDLSPELVFLDVQMPGLSGFDVLTRIRVQPKPAVVFVTAYDRYALQAFEVHAVDFLLKPFTDDRLRDTLDHVVHRVRNRRDMARLNERLEALLQRMDAEPAAPAFLSRITVRDRDRTVLVDVTEIDWIEAAGNYVLLHAGKRTWMHRTTMTEMEEQLDPDQFVRIHRSCIVNVHGVRELRPLSSGDCLLVLEDGTELTSSRTYGVQRRQAFGRLG